MKTYPKDIQELKKIIGFCLQFHEQFTGTKIKRKTILSKLLFREFVKQFYGLIFK